MIKVVSDSSKLTKQIAAKFVSSVVNKQEGPYIFLMKGDLGSGKTTFVLGALSYFGIRPHAASPTFVLVKHYKPLRNYRHRKSIMDIYHVDAYRLRSKKDLEMLELPFEKENALFFIEWPERAGIRSLKGAFVLSFSHALKNKPKKKRNYGTESPANERVI